MRLLVPVAALAAVAFLLPGEASADPGGFLDRGRGGGGPVRGGGGGGRVSLPRSGGGPSFRPSGLSGRAPSAPRAGRSVPSAPRGPSVSRGDLFRGQGGVPRGGQPGRVVSREQPGRVVSTRNFPSAGPDLRSGESPGRVLRTDGRGRAGLPSSDASARGFRGTRTGGPTGDPRGARDSLVPGAPSRTDGFVGPSPSGRGGAGLVNSGALRADGGKSGFRTASAGTGYPYRDGYRAGLRDGYRDSRYRYHDWYDHHGWSVSFVFSTGFFAGSCYYSPFHHWRSGYDYAFFYPAPIAFAYVPFGFYCDTTPVYVTRSVYVREVPVTAYETRVVEVEKFAEEDEAGGAATAVEKKVLEPVPAAGSPATEKYLREASEAFRKGGYYDAAVKFRLAALSAPGQAAPLFAFGQALLAMGEDAYAAKVIRKGLLTDAMILGEPADVSGVYRDPAEFDRVMRDLRARAEASPEGSDARFLLAWQQYFTGDPAARETLRGLTVALPEDRVVKLLADGVEQRFKAAGDLPEVEKK